MRKKEILTCLKQVPLFSGLSQRQLSAVSRSVDEIDVASGTELALQGELGREMFVIVEGTAVVRRNNRKIGTLGPGEAFGEMSLIDQQERTASVRVTEDSTLLVLRGRAFKPLLDDVPQLSRSLLETMCARLREADKKLYD